MLGHRPLSAAEYPGIWRRRRKWALLCLLLGLAVGYALARTLPASYTSTAAIEVTRILGAGSGTAVAEEVTGSQLSALQERVLTQERLHALRGLVAPLAFRAPASGNAATEDPLAEMRRNIVLKPAPRGFKISFTGGDAGVAQQVCAAIAKMFTEPHTPDNGVSAAGLLDGQVKDAKRKLDAQEAKLATFQRRHGGEPSADDEAETRNSLMGYNVQLEAANGALQRALQERMALTASIQATESAGSRPLQAAELPNVQALEQELATEQAKLVTLQARYTPDHPDVVKQKTNIAQLQRKIDEAKAAAAPKNSDAALAAEPPQVAQMRAQVQELDRTVQEKTAEQSRLQGEIRAARERLVNDAALDQESKQLARDRDAAQTNYNALLAKQSGMIKAIQTGQRADGSAFRLVEAANLPGAPSFPNPILFTLGGAGGGLGLGLLVMVLGELTDKTLRTEGDIEHYLDLPTLAVIPPADGPGGNDSEGRGGSRALRNGSGSGEKEESVLADV